MSISKSIMNCLAELAFTIKKALGNLVGEVLYFTESTIAMCWSFHTNKKLRICVLNRVNLIKQMIKWTTGEQDLLTKPQDFGPADLTVDSVWQSGFVLISV